MIQKIIIFILGSFITGGIFVGYKYFKPKNEDLIDKEIYDQSVFLSSATSDGLILLDAKGNIKIMNQLASDLTGWTVSDALNLNYKSIIKLVDNKNELLPDNINPILNVLASHENLINSQSLISNKTNTTVPVSISIAKLDTDTNSMQMLIVLRDITSVKKRDQERSDFISTASHEMRTPIATIEGFLSLATMTATDSKLKSYIEKSLEQTSKLGKLFEDLLTSAKVDDGLMKPEPINFSLNDLFNQMVPYIKNTAEAKKLNFIYKNSDQSTPNEKAIIPIFKINADPKQIQEIVKQLASNAIKFTESGTVTLGLSGDAESIHIFVSDTGKGISQNDIPHLFQKFYRLDNSETRDNGGTGLGLFISKSLTELNNGKIWIESEVGKGTTIHLKFNRSKI